MHYSNGREAKVGDLVRGKGYNYKHEIVGILVQCAPALITCNCTVACIGVRSDWPTQMTAHVGYDFDGKLKVIDAIPEVRAVLEYGQLDGFVAINPATGGVLEPVETPAAVA